jgi:hypothetical protein
MAVILIENVSLLSHKLQIAAAPNEQGRRGRDRMVVGFITTCAISAYHH